MIESSQRAFTLPELLLSLSLLGMLASLALPRTGAWLERNRHLAARHELSASIRLGRAHAIIHGRSVTLCPSNDGRRCGGDWGEGWLLTEDGRERPILQHRLQTKETIRWSRSNFLKFLPNGQLNIHNGRFLLCADHTVAWQWVLNRQGRLRAGTPQENREKGELCGTSS